jgi:hypothetical protein
MRWSKTNRWILSIVFGLFLVVLGVPEAPVYHGETSLGQEYHGHEDAGPSTEASGHCHPGLDCSVTAVVFLQPNVVYEPQLLTAVMQDAATQLTELRSTSDPPPPRRWV